MNNYVGTIDTDAGIGTILGYFSTEYINHVIDDSLGMKFRPFNEPMPNMVDVLERNFIAVRANSPDYVEKVDSVRNETYREIIQRICKYYNLTFTGDFDSISAQELYGIAHLMYDVFISRFTDYMMNFFVSYIVNNADSIESYLKCDESYIKPKESGLYDPTNFIDPKFIIIHANANKVIWNMAAYDIPLQMLLQYFLGPKNGANMSMYLQDNGDIYKNHYASYILNPVTSAGVLTNVKLMLKAKTQEINNV